MINRRRIKENTLAITQHSAAITAGGMKLWVVVMRFVLELDFVYLSRDLKIDTYLVELLYVLIEDYVDLTMEITKQKQTSDSQP